MDQTTANYSLNLWGGKGQEFTLTDARDRALKLQVAGLLNDSVFQGDLLLGEEALRRYDPDVVGYCYFLIETPADKTAQVQQALQRVLGDYGFRSETTAQRLAALAAVQNTYLATFQSLGGLGLMLGTIGLAVVQWRNVLERRGELALLRGRIPRKHADAYGRCGECRPLDRGPFCRHRGGFGGRGAATGPHAGTVPWELLGTVLAMVLAVGLLVSLIAMRGVVRAPILAALREER